VFYFDNPNRQKHKKADLILNGPAQIWNGFRFVFYHVPAVAIAPGHVFINAVVAFDEFGKTKIAQFTV
jgi:hypothetical protein